MIGGKEKFRSWLPHGFDFLPPEDTRRLRNMETRIRSIFESADYQEVVPPTLDFAPTFGLSAGGADAEAFETRDSDGETLAVRSDLTVQVVKALSNGRVAGNFPARLFYIQNVFRDRAWGSGFRREITQAGIELVGDGRTRRVHEIADLARKCLETLGIEPRILFGDARFVEILLSRAAEEKRPALLGLLHRKDTQALRNLAPASGMDTASAALLVELPLLFGSDGAVDRLKKLSAHIPELTAILNDCTPGILYDFSMVRDAAYYTGPVFEAYARTTKQKVLSGGVYDRLFSRFSAADRTACGFAINLTACAEDEMRRKPT